MQLSNQRKTNIASFFIALCMTLAGANFLTSAPAHATPHAGQKTGQSLHRVDFRVEGASCVVCLRRCGKEFRETKGVLKADVSIYRPYWSIVIYDANETNWDKISQAVKNEKVKLVDVADKPIAEMPLIIIPKGLNEKPKVQ